MTRRSSAGPERSKSRGGKTKPQRLRVGLKATRLRNTSVAGHETQSDVAQLTRERDEALEREKATAELLRVISTSPSELEPVFQTMLANATRICEAKFANLFLREGQAFRHVATYGASAEFVETRRRNPIVTVAPGTGLGRVVVTKKPEQIADIQAEPAYAGEPSRTPLLKFGARTLLTVPMLKKTELVGAIGIYRQEVRPFTDKQIELVTNFAAQAVIAMENTRLLNELRQRTDDLSDALDRQTAMSDVLGLISSSPSDLQPVFQAIVESAARLCAADNASIYRTEDEHVRHVATHGKVMTLEVGDARPLARGSMSGHVIISRETIHIADALAVAETEFPDSRPAIERQGIRTVLGLPLLHGESALGAIVLRRMAVQAFSDKQIELVQNFAAQAVIAIENTRLLNELRQRTDDLSNSLDNLRTAQDRLVQTEKLASLGQLTAGIAHEIKNPLNFVNNFSAVSVELIDELREVLAGAHLDGKLRAEISEIADMLQGNLDKVVQHGKRADTIVKNMLLHSRQGSGEHRPVDVNALVEESLNLAYHGARAEKQGFNITMEKSFDPAAGEVDLFPQEITRVLLNLISNGFYAATKRKAEADGGRYEPILAATTKSLGDRVEISIRDNGTGIPPEVKEKMFNPFFTTKPAGEGTGLGLSISHDIIVKQHGGSIEVDTRPGEFTEFRIVLPRAGASLIKSGERISH